MDVDETADDLTPLITKALENFIKSAEGIEDTFKILEKSIAEEQWKITKEIMENTISILNEYLEYREIDVKESIIRLIKDKEIIPEYKIFDAFTESLDSLGHLLNKGTSWMKSSSQRLPSINRHFANLAKKSKKLNLANNLVKQSSFISLISQYDAFLGNLIRTLSLMKPETLNVSEKNISFSQLQAFNTIKDARDFIIEKEVENFLRKSHHEQLEWLEKQYNIEIRKDLTTWNEFIEVTERRNLFVHNSGIISNQYIGVCRRHNITLNKTVKVGDELDISDIYFEEAYNYILENGIKIAHLLWRKIQPQSLEKADSNLQNVCYELLIEERYKLARNILDFATEKLKRHFSDSNKRMFVVNRAQAYKWAGENERAQSIIKSMDWSASSDDFKLAKAVIVDDFKLANQLVKKIGANGDITLNNYRDWPLFKDYRKTEEFLKTFEEVFHEPFYSEQDLFVTIDWIKDAIESAKNRQESQQLAIDHPT